MNTNHSQGRSEGLPADPAENIVQLTGADQPLNSMSLEQKRQVNNRVNEIMVKRLNLDAQKLEESAIVGDHTIQKRHQLMDLARCLRTAVTWIAGPQIEGAKQ